jgi:hypothetical protein
MSIPNSISDILAIATDKGYSLTKNKSKVDVTYPNNPKVYSYTGSIVAVALKLGLIDQGDSDRIRNRDDRYLQPISKDSKPEISTADHIAKLEKSISTLRVGSPIHKVQLKMLADLKSKLA